MNSILQTVWAIAKSKKDVQISICVFDSQWYVCNSFKNQNDSILLKECYSERRFTVSGVSLYIWWCLHREKVKVKFTFELIPYDNLLFCKDRWIFHLTSIQFEKEKWWNFEKDRHCLIQLVSIDLMLFFLSIDVTWDIIDSYDLCDLV